jgi:hypothetical protein
MLAIGVKSRADLIGRKLRMIRKLTNLTMLAALTLIAGILPSAVRAQKLTFKIPPTAIRLTVKDQPVTITAFGVVSMLAQERDLAVFNVELDADLSDLQRNITPLLSEELDKDDHCGDRIAIQRATLVPLAPASLTSVELHYERWGCAKVFGKEQAKRLIGGNAVVQMKLTPSIDRETGGLRLDPEVGEIQADGSLGELIRTGSVGEILRQKVQAAMLNALKKGTNLFATLPPAIQEHASIQNIQFKDGGAGRLLVVLNGEARISKEEVQLLAQQVKERSSSTH